MRVAQINLIYKSGSIGRIEHDLHEMMIKEGISSHIFNALDYTHSTECTSYMNILDLRISQIENRILGNQGFGYFTKTKQMIKDIRRFQPDIIHIHNLHAFYVNCEQLFQFLYDYGKPVVWTFHDCWPFTGHCAYFDMTGCNKWKTGCGSCEFHWSVYPNSLVDRTSHFYHIKKQVFNKISNLTIVTPSKWLADLVKQSFLSSHSIKVINNGIDLSRFKVLDKQKLKVKYGFERKKVILGVASTGFSGRKGLADFVELSQMLSKDFQIILIGANANDKKIIPNNIIALQRTESIEQLNEYYSMADFFVNPTHEDNFPTTNLESLACGTPVITYPSGGSPESVSSECGFVTIRKSAREIFEAISNNCMFSSEVCRSAAVTMYSKEKFAKEYINLYRQLVKA